MTQERKLGLLTAVRESGILSVVLEYLGVSWERAALRSFKPNIENLGRGESPCWHHGHPTAQQRVLCDDTCVVFVRSGVFPSHHEHEVHGIRGEDGRFGTDESAD